MIGFGGPEPLPVKDARLWQPLVHEPVDPVLSCAVLLAALRQHASKGSRLAATALQRRSAVASVLLELCGVIKTFGTSWNGRRDGRRSGSAGVGYCHQTSSGHRPGGPLSARHKAHPGPRSPPA